MLIVARWLRSRRVHSVHHDNRESSGDFSLRFRDSFILVVVVVVVVLLQSTDLVSMVYSCIGAEIEDSDGSSSCDVRETDEHEADRTAAASAAPADAPTNGRAASSSSSPSSSSSSTHHTDRRAESRPERVAPPMVPEEEREGVGSGGARPEPPPQSIKPSLAAMRQRHLQDNLGTAALFDSSYKRI